MFLGYVFTDSILDERIFVDLAYKNARFSKCIFKLIGDENIYYAKLSEDEKEFL